MFRKKETDNKYNTWENEYKKKNGKRALYIQLITHWGYPELNEAAHKAITVDKLLEWAVNDGPKLKHTGAGSAS